MINNRYIKNQEVTVEGLQLQVTPTGTVYNCTKRGMVKLDSLWLPKIGQLSISLPNGNLVVLKPTKDGLKTLAEIKELKEKL